jgi:hypothetical protein
MPAGLKPFRLTAPPARERDLQRACLQYLTAARCLAYRTNVVNVGGEDEAGHRRWVRGLPRGHPDVFALVPPAFHSGGDWALPVFVECKAPRKRPTPWQEAFGAKLRGAGALLLTVYSLDDLRRGLRAAGVQAP